MAQLNAKPETANAPAAELMEHLGYLLNVNTLRYKAQVEAALEPLGLSGRFLGVLVVAAAHGPLSQQRLGQYVGVDRSTMVLLLDGLEARALVERQSVASDRRSHAVAITAKGRKVLEQALGIAESVEKDFLAPLSQAEQKALRGLLDRLILAHHPQEEES